MSTRPSTARKTSSTRPSTTRKTLGRFAMIQTLTAEIYTTAIPGYADAVSLVAQLEQHVREAQAQRDADGENPGEMTALVIATAQAGDNVLNVCHELVEQRRRRENAGEVQGLVLNAAQQARNRLDELTRTHTTEVVAEIRARVEDLGEHLATMTQPIPSTADAAINSGRVDDYTAARDAVGKWTSLAIVYSAATRNGLQSHQLRDLVPAAFTPDPLNQHPLFLDRRANIAVGAQFAVHTPQPLVPIIEWAHSKTNTAGFTPRSSGGSPVPEGVQAGVWMLYLVQDGPLTVHDPETALHLWDLATKITAPLNAKIPAEAIARHVYLAQYAEILGRDEDHEHHATQARELERSRRRGSLR